MRNIKNNIFEFATKELSQDAVICWCVNWFNQKNSELYPLAVDLLKLITDLDDNNLEDEIVIKKQLYKIDILIYFKKTGKAVIVEDKVYSSEHHDQIVKYKNIIASISDSEKNKLGMKELNEIRTVYFKTGFFYDNDKMVEADKIVQGKEFLEIVGKYKDKNTILQMYYEYLEGLIIWYEDYGKFYNMGAEDFWNWNIVNHQIAQYNLMRAIFPENEWWNKRSEDYMVYHGTNKGSGRPWTQMFIYRGVFDSRSASYTVFWRIDTDEKGPYISLRFYDDYDKNSEKEKQEHIIQYRYHKDQIEGIISNSVKDTLDICKEVVPDKTANYKEAVLFHVHISDILIDWANKEKEFTTIITEITDKFRNENLVEKGNRSSS